MKLYFLWAFVMGWLNCWFVGMMVTGSFYPWGG